MGGSLVPGSAGSGPKCTSDVLVAGRVSRSTWMSHPRPGGWSLKSMCFGQKAGLLESGSPWLFQQPIGVKVRMQPLEGGWGLPPFSRRVRGQGSVYKVWLLLFKALQRSKGTHRDQDADTEAHTETRKHVHVRNHRRTHAHTHTPSHAQAHLRAYLPAVVLSDMHSVLLSDRGTWEAGAGLTPR